jgi:hypothetical protein
MPSIVLMPSISGLAEGGRSLSRSFRLVVSITCLLIFQGAYAIDMHFSASDGGGSVSIWDHYDVDDSVEVSGTTLASFGEDLAMDDSRKISGPGDVYAVQGYAGSGGYSGASYIYAQDASHTLALGSSHLTPGSLGVSQGVSIDGAAESAVVSTANRDGRGAMQHALVWDGSLKSTQTIGVDGGIATSQDTQMVGYLPTAFGTAGYLDVNLGPTNLKIEGEGAAVGVSSIDSRDGNSEVDCSLATGTGNSAWARGNIRSATSDRGGVGAGAGAGNVDFGVDWTGGLPGLYIDGEAEAAGIGLAAVGKKNVIRGTLAASTGDDGTAASGQNVEASNRDGIALAAAAAGGLGANICLQQGIAGGGAEAAAIGVAAVSENKNEISAGSLGAATGPAGTGAYGEDVEASSKDGFVAAAAAAGGLGAGVNFQNGLPNATMGAGAEAAVVGVVAVSENKNEINAGSLGAATGLTRTGAYGEDVEASNKDGFVAAVAAAGGLGAGVNLQNGSIGAGAEAALVGVAAVSENKNEISAGTLAAATGPAMTGAYCEDVEASSKDGFVAAAAAAGGLGAGIDLRNGTIGGGAEAAAVGVAAVGEKKNNISAGTLAAGTGLIGTGAYGEDVGASNKKGTVGAAAIAGGLGAELNFQNGLPNATIGAGAEAGVVGVVANGKNNEIGAGALAAGAGRFGAGARGEDIEASNEKGFIVAVAGAGGLGATIDLSNGNGTIGAEGAIFGAGANGSENQISVGGVGATTGNSADVVAVNVDARSIEGAAGTGVAAGNVQLQLTGGTMANLTAEGSAVGAGGYGATADVSADRLAAESGDSTSAQGDGMWLTVIQGDGIIGAISGVYDSSGPEELVASVSGDVTAGSAMIWGDFSADTNHSATASAENVGALVGTQIHLGSHGDDGSSSSDVDTTLGAGGLNFGEMEAYAGDSTRATQEYRALGNVKIEAEASNPPYPLAQDSDVGWLGPTWDVTGEARTDNTGAYADTNVAMVI